MNVPPAVGWLIPGLFLCGHFWAEVKLLRRLLPVSFKTALSACLAADASAAALATGAYLLGKALVAGLTYAANLAAGNFVSNEFIGTAGLQAACLLGFLALRAALIPPLVGRAGRLLHLDGVPLGPETGRGRRALKLTAWTLLSAAATAAFAAAAWGSFLAASALHYLIVGH